MSIALFFNTVFRHATHSMDLEYRIDWLETFAFLSKNYSTFLLDSVEILGLWLQIQIEGSNLKNIKI